VGSAAGDAVMAATGNQQADGQHNNGEDTAQGHESPSLGLGGLWGAHGFLLKVGGLSLSRAAG
jgi:hypothetical protein